MQWDHVVDAITAADSLLLVAHVSPDGDALGSALGVALAIDAMPGERRVTVSFGDDPFVVPANLSWLPGQRLLRPAVDVVAEATGPDVVLTFDSSSLDRLGLLIGVAERAPLLVAVDHHASYDGFGHLALVDVTSPATAVVARELVARLDVPLDQSIAACLYTGLITDTGSFRYAGTTAATHALAGELLATGMAFDEIAREVFDTAPFEYLGMLGRALSRCVLDAEAAEGRGLVWTVVLAADRAEHQLPFDLVEPVIDVVRKASAAEVAMVVKEDDLGDLRVSLRSKGAVDVARAAVALGGGGHRYAAGFTAVSRDVDDVVGSVTAELAADD
jgi:bifunctional oligoribonuclease and PAP phosphatase NrnA